MSRPILKKDKTIQQVAAQSQPRNDRPQSIDQTPQSFHNPYNFVPALPRDKVTNELGDRQPVGHDRYLPEHWSGSIRVKLTTKTPLLIPDAFHVSEENDHKTFPLRMLNGKPYLPPTSIKGMLRAAYESVTNSRLSVFDKHDDRLFYRMSAGDGLSLVPAIVDGNTIKLMRGSTKGYPTKHNDRWNIDNRLMYAAWLPRKLINSNLKHGDRVCVWLEQYQKTNRDVNVLFKHWRVLEIVPYNLALGTRPNPGIKRGNYAPVNDVGIIKVDGYLCITGNNIDRKHDERVFFNIPNPQSRENYDYSLLELSKDWEYLIKDYQQLHKGEVRKEDLEWSRHVIGGNDEHKLVSPNRQTLCYAFVDTSSKVPKITALYPVMISRAIYHQSPSEILSPNNDSNKLKPATSIDNLSPADRVFGWINQEGSGAHKGQLRITAIDAPDLNSIEPFTIPLTISILGAPKPQQSRFYAAKDTNGTPLSFNCDKATGYIKDSGLRGRKVYPHHQISLADYWKVDRSRTLSVGDRYREYLSPEQKKSSQNRSISAWVKPEETFTFNIEITNLSSVELGALLWLLELQNNNGYSYFRLGGGKPLGFGSVCLEISKIEVRNGENLGEFYSSLTKVVPENDLDVRKDCIQLFRDAVEHSYGEIGNFDSISFITAFLKCSQGFVKPIHYPRMTKAPQAEGESFKWFVANENSTNREPRKHSLGDLSNDPGLPIWARR